MKTKTIIPTLAAIGMLLAAVSCDFSALFGEDSKQAALTIQGFRIEKSKNGVLEKTAGGIIEGDDIHIVLPYRVLENNIPLSPTISISPGSSVSPSSGVPVSFRDPVSYTVKRGGDYHTYTVYASVDPESMTFLRVADPFYVNAEGREVPLSRYSIQREVTRITLVLDTLDYLNAEARRVGFGTLHYPYNAVVSPALLYGNIPPYTITVSSETGVYSEQYEIDMVRSEVANTDIVSITATCREIYDCKEIPSSNKKEYEAFLKEKNGSFKNSDCLKSTWTVGQCDNYGSYTYVQNGSDYAANIDYHNRIESFNDETRTYTTLSAPFELAVSKIIANNISYDPPVSFGVTNTLSFKFRSHFTVEKCILDTYPVYSQYETSYSSRTFTFTSTVETSYEARDYYKLLKLIITAPHYCRFKNIYTSSLCSSHTVGGTQLEVIIRDAGYEKVTGLIGIFDIVSETGEEKTHFLVIEE